MAFRSPRALHRASSVLLALVATLTFAAPPSAHAQDAELPDVAVPDSAPEAPASASPIARAILVEAVAEYEAGHYAEAQALFARAQDLSPSARTLRGLGMASFEMRRYADAVHAFDAALVATERPLTESQREHVEALLARARGFVSTLRLDVSPADASVRIDGAAPEAEPDGTLLLDPGTHVITVERVGHRTQTLEVQLAPGTTEVRTIALAMREPDPTPPVAPGDDSLWWAAAGFGGAAAVGLVAAAITGTIALVDQDQLQASCAGYVCPESLRSTRDRARDLSVATDVLGTTAAVLGVASLALVVAAVASANSSSPSASAMCTPDGCSVSFGGAL